MALKFAVNNSLSAVTSLPTAIPTGSMTLLQTQTASSSSTIDFTSNIDSTYDVYCFKFINIHPSTDQAIIQFQGSTNGGSSYGVTITSTAFRARHYESDSVAQLGYRTGDDLAQSTSFQYLNSNTGSDNDECASGYLTIYNPSNTTFVKHFISNFNSVASTPDSSQHFIAGYFNTTSALNAFQFKMGSGTIESGDIKLYGIS